MNKDTAIKTNQITIDRLMQLFQFLLFVLSLTAVPHLGMKHLTPIGIMCISFDWMAMIMLIVIFRNCCNGRNSDTTNIIKLLIITLYICIFFEFGSWMIDTLPGFRIANYICNIGANCMILIGTYIYLLFLRKSLQDKNYVDIPWMNNMLHTALIVGVTAEILNVFGGYFYIITEENIYVRSPYGSILGYLPFLVLITGGLLYIFRQKIDLKTKLSYSSYCIFPFLCSLWYTATGYPPTFFTATALSILLIHGDIYVEQSRKAEIFELENAKKDAEYALSQNKLMLSQIRPHFLYNALGSIEVLCRLDPEKAGRAIHHFTHYLRSNMDIVKNEETIPFSQELEHIRNYVWLEQIRFEDDLEYKEELETTDFRVPQLAIQPIVENAIKHGMMGNEDGVLHVTLKTQELDSEYIINICDDGCGFDLTKVPDDGKAHLGIQSAAYSLKYSVDGSMNVDSRIGNGTIVTIHIPKQKEGDANDDTCCR